MFHSFALTSSDYSRLAGPIDNHIKPIAQSSILEHLFLGTRSQSLEVQEQVVSPCRSRLDQVPRIKIPVHQEQCRGNHHNRSTNMLATRALKPKLSLTIATQTPAQANKPILPLNLRSPVTPLAPLRSPMFPPLSPLPASPTACNTKINQKGFSTIAQQPTYSYVNTSTSKSILKRTQTTSPRSRQIQFSEAPVVHSIAPIEDPEYYGGYKKMTRDERRWMVKFG